MDFLMHITIPALNGNWIDLIILVLLLFFFLEGLVDRFIPAALNLVGFILTYAMALKFYSVAAHFFIANFSLPRGIANALGFFAVAILVEAIYNIVSTLIYQRIPPTIRLAAFNRYLGFLPSFGNGIILTAFILTLIITLPTAPFVKKAILDSKIGSLLVLRTQTIERQINNVFGQAVNETLTFLTVHPNPENPQRVDLKFTTKEFTVDVVSEERMLSLVNEERRQRGAGELKSEPALVELSRAYAKDMFEKGYFSHYNPQGDSPFDRMEKSDIEYTAAGENLAYAPNVEVAHKGLMESRGHRENILSGDFGKVGIGVIDGGIYGKMFVQEFTD